MNPHRPPYFTLLGSHYWGKWVFIGSDHLRKLQKTPTNHPNPSGGNTPLTRPLRFRKRTKKGNFSRWVLSNLLGVVWRRGLGGSGGVSPMGTTPFWTDEIGTKTLGTWGPQKSVLVPKIWVKNPQISVYLREFESSHPDILYWSLKPLFAKGLFWL
jgi:hypothetical protein